MVNARAEHPVGWIKRWFDEAGIPRGKIRIRGDLGDYRRSNDHDDRQETEAEIVDQDRAFRRIHGLAEPSSGRVVCVTRALSVRAIA